ncbi:RraA family protein [Thalassobacillus devorans]|uniref:RraA family protein n=1 Tax=Thalassobacillus devorans TaxID=279813 RepID=UPI000A1C9F0E|nr:RraA family protein [Thalassobacillus devorans]
MNIGFRILPVKQRINKGVVKQFRNIVTPHISDNMNRLHAGGTELQPFHKEGKLLGTAITVKTRPGDNLMVHKALDLALPGDVIVVDAGGDTTNAIVGEIMQRIAKKKGIAGFVINGAIRDSLAFMEDTFPVYAKGVTHRGPYKDGPGEVNGPISLGGMIINSGDLIVGDEDGLVAVPAEEVEGVLLKAKEQEKKEKEIFRLIEDGKISRSWVDEVLKEKGCKFEKDHEPILTGRGNLK